MEAILEGRAEYAATLADLGFVPGDFVQHTRRGVPSAGAGGGGGPKPFAGPAFHWNRTAMIYPRDYPEGARGGLVCSCRLAQH